MIDITSIENEVQQELAEERKVSVKKRIKAKLGEIAKIEQALANARLEYRELLADISLEQ